MFVISHSSCIHCVCTTFSSTLSTCFLSPCHIFSEVALIMKQPKRKNVKQKKKSEIVKNQKKEIKKGYEKVQKKKIKECLVHSMDSNKRGSFSASNKLFNP